MLYQDRGLQEHKFCNTLEVCLNDVLIFFVGLVFRSWPNCPDGTTSNCYCLLVAKGGSIEFLRIRRVPLEERQCSDEAPNITPQIRLAAKKDREIMEKGVKTFVSYVRAYNEHQCSFIFRWKDLEIGKYKTGGYQVQRKVSGEAKKEKPGSETSCERAKKKRHSKATTNAASTSVATSKKTGKQRRSVQSTDDADELERDYRLLKKLKKGRIDENEFAKLTGEEDL
ncbi:RNA helicase [Salvia divinorum]|uniref:RNA helicase n=1 Tax=Salvia divinorum TaxID=28513 RepID=A0ABD1HTK2_SALDI